MIRAITSIIANLWGHVPIRNAIAKDHAAKMTLEIVVSGHRLRCIRRVAGMGLSSGKVDLRRVW